MIKSTMLMTNNDKSRKQNEKHVSGNDVAPLLNEENSVRITKVTVVLPLYNEAESVESICSDLHDKLREGNYIPSILIIDDGSTDNSLEVMSDLSRSYPYISYISFSRNFGKEAAVIAGLQECGDDFDVVAYMDSDGQHSSTDLLRMLEAAKSPSVDLVCGARADRRYQSWIQQCMATAFYKLFNLTTEHDIEEGVGDFNVLKPKVVAALRGLKEEHLFVKGLIAWVGFNRIIIPINIENRIAGSSQTSTSKLLRLAGGAFLSFSAWPLRAWSIVGITSAAASLLYLSHLVIRTIIYGRDIPGYATTICLILGIGGLQLFSVGILGEYIARIYTASKRRPRYIIAERS